jgi:hypothetical protein
MRCLVLLLLLLLAACAPYPAPATDPRLQAANALSTLTYATQVAAIERERAVEATRAAGVEAARMQEESDLISTRAAGTVQALQVQLTAGAATLGVDLATSDARSTMDAARMTATPAAATEAAVVAGIERDRLANERAAALNRWMWLPFAALALGVLYALVQVVRIRAYRAEMEIAWRDREKSLYPTRNGIIVFQDAPFAYLPMPREERPIIMTGYTAPEYLSPSTSVSAPAANPDEATRLVREFLARAIEQAGAEANQVPSKDKMGIASSHWQWCMGKLRQVGAVWTEPNRGSYVAQRYGNLDNVLYEIETGHLRLSPTPPEAVRDARHGTD